MLDLFNNVNISYNLRRDDLRHFASSSARQHFEYCPPLESVNHWFSLSDFGTQDAKLKISNNKIKLIPPCSYLLNPGRLLSRRGNITEFSPHSKSRFESKLDNYKVFWQSFITLTFRAPHLNDPDFRKVFDIRFVDERIKNSSSSGQSMRLAYQLLKRWVQAVCRLPMCAGSPPLFFWKKEFTARGVVHFHLISNFDFKPYVKNLQKIWSHLTFNPFKNSCDVRRVKKQKSITWYIAKYVSKSDKKNNPFCSSAPLGLTFGFVGRWWGSFNTKYYKNRFFLPREYQLDFHQFEILYKALLRRGKIHFPDSIFRTLTLSNTDENRYFCKSAFSIGWNISAGSVRELPDKILIKPSEENVLRDLLNFFDSVRDENV